MPNNPQVAALVILAVIAAAVSLFLSGGPDAGATAWYQAMTTSISAVGVGLVIFHRWLWRYLPDFLAPKPDLNGTWSVILKPGVLDEDEANRGTRRTLEPIVAYAFVTQRYFRLEMKVVTQRTTSHLLSESIQWSTKHQAYELTAIYSCGDCDNLVGQPHELDHNGAMQLTYSKQGTRVGFRGRYWMDRILKIDGVNPSHNGSMELSGRKEELYVDFDAADQAFNPSQPTSVRRAPTADEAAT